MSLISDSYGNVVITNSPQPTPTSEIPSSQKPLDNTGNKNRSGPPVVPVSPQAIVLNSNNLSLRQDYLSWDQPDFDPRRRVYEGNGSLEDLLSTWAWYELSFPGVFQSIHEWAYFAQGYLLNSDLTKILQYPGSSELQQGLDWGQQSGQLLITLGEAGAPLDLPSYAAPGLTYGEPVDAGGWPAVVSAISQTALGAVQQNLYPTDVITNRFYGARTCDVGPGWYYGQPYP